MADQKLDEARRRFERTKKEKNLIGLISFKPETTLFKPTRSALVIEESAMGGCGIVVIISSKFQIGRKIKIKIGINEPTLAEICWIKELDNSVARMGLKFLK